MELKNRDKRERALRLAYQQAGYVTRRRIIKYLSQQVGLPLLDSIPWMIWGEYQNLLKSSLEKPLRETYRMAAKDLSDEYKMRFAWDIVNERAAYWADNYTYELVKDITKTDERLLQNTISKFYTEELTLDELTQLVRRSPAFGEARANLIAITETTRASVQGEYAIVEEIERQGFKIDDIWVTNVDEKVCGICGLRDGKKQGEDWIEPPPAHPGCRCWVNHVPEGVVIEQASPIDVVEPEEKPEIPGKPRIETRAAFTKHVEELYPEVKVKYGRTFPKDPEDRKKMWTVAADRMTNLKKRGIPGKYLPEEIRFGYKSDFTKQEIAMGVIGKYNSGNKTISFNPIYIATSFNKASDPVTTGDWILGDVFSHEIGHAVQYQFLEDLVGHYVIPYFPTSDLRSIYEKHVSKYGSKQSVELVAEVFTGLMHDVKFPAIILDKYKDFGGPPVKGAIKYSPRELEKLKGQWKQ